MQEKIISKGNLFLEDRKKLNLTGVIEVMSFNEEQILLDTKLGSLAIKGSDLKMNKLDVKNGDVIVIGKISSIVYLDKQVKKDKKNIIEKLFK